MQRFVSLVVSRPQTMIFAVAAVTAVLAFQLRSLRLDVNLRDELPQGHPYMRIDDRLSARLGAEQTTLLAVGVREGGVFTPATLRKLQRLTTAVMHLPGVVPTSGMSLASRR